MKLSSLAITAALMSCASGAHAEWRLVETPHVSMSGDLPEAEMRTLATEVERLDALMMQVTGASPQPATRVVIRLFATNEEARTRSGLPRLQGGVTHWTPDGPMIIAARVDGVPDALRVAVFHEYSHAFRRMHFAGPRPLWFEEGFATFFESAEPLADGQMRYGPNPMRRESIRRAGLTRVGSILALDPDSEDGPPPEAFYDTGWLVEHYVFAGGPRRKELEAFITAFARGDSVTALDGYFAGGIAGLDHDLLADANLPGEFERTVAVQPATDIAVRAMSELEVEKAEFTVGMSGEVGMKSRDDHYALTDRWLDQLEGIGRKFPGDLDIARLAGRIALMNGSTERAFPIVESALATHPDDPSLLALKGTILTIRADKGKVEEFDANIAIARKVVDRALALGPKNVDALVAKARNLRASDGATPAVAALLERALALDPLNADLRGNLGETYDRIGDKKRSIATMIPSAESDPNPEVRRAARRAIAAMRKGYVFQ